MMKEKWMHLGMILSFAAISSLCGCGVVCNVPTSTMQAESTESVQIQPVQTEFPIPLSGGALVAEKLVSYQGPFWEDGSADIVENVAGLMLYNSTDRMVEFAAVVLEQAEDQLYFFVYRLPPKSRCLILERDRKPCQEEISACRELCVRWDYQELSREQLDYVGLGPLLTVVNRDSHRQEHVILWYKQYVKSDDYYLGGVAYSAHMFFLQPQEQRTIMPEHYDAGNARVVAIKLET